jgi:cytochrome bd-type quinol oxidase subunit 1
MPDQSTGPNVPRVELSAPRRAPLSRVLAVLEYVLAVLMGIVGAALILYAALLTLRAGTPEQEQWYESVALIPFVPAVFLLSGAGWLIRDAGERL